VEAGEGGIAAGDGNCRLKKRVALTVAEAGVALSEMGTNLIIKK
jgi:hypothetical protein